MESVIIIIIIIIIMIVLMVSLKIARYLVAFGRPP